MLKVYCVWDAEEPPPNCSARKLAVGFGLSPAVISLAPTALSSNSLARTFGLVSLASRTACSSVSVDKRSWARTSPAAPRSARQHTAVTILTISVSLGATLSGEDEGGRRSGGRSG